jgi:hypothetical protein
MSNLRDDVEHHLPLTGPHTADTVVTGVDALGHVFRYLNHATFPGATSLQLAHAIDSTITGLRDAVGGLDQLLDHLVEASRFAAADPTLYDDRRDSRYPPDLMASTLALVLADARLQAQGLWKDLDRAAGVSSHLGNEDESALQ